MKCSDTRRPFHPQWDWTLAGDQGAPLFPLESGEGFNVVGKIEACWEHIVTFFRTFRLCSSSSSVSVEQRPLDHRVTIKGFNTREDLKTASLSPHGGDSLTRSLTTDNLSKRKSFHLTNTF